MKQKLIFHMGPTNVEISKKKREQKRIQVLFCSNNLPMFVALSLWGVMRREKGEMQKKDVSI